MFQCFIETCGTLLAYADDIAITVRSILKVKTTFLVVEFPAQEGRLRVNETRTKFMVQMAKTALTHTQHDGRGCNPESTDSFIYLRAGLRKGKIWR